MITSRGGAKIVEDEGLNRNYMEVGGTSPCMTVKVTIHREEAWPTKGLQHREATPGFASTHHNLYNVEHRYIL